ncbi:MAG: hypothetical protein E7646_04890 [Ruminococcaceae bacterium]|nr:hypothetical protein [Oscillospiraceae bacterium]
MAVYKIKRNGPKAEKPKEQVNKLSAESAEAIEQSQDTVSISRNKNRSLDNYVGTGKQGRRSKEKVGSIVDAVYNTRETADDFSINDTDRMLLEAFSDDKKLKKEKKRLEKERAKEEKKRLKMEKKLKASGNVQDDPYADSLGVFDEDISVDRVYNEEELKLSLARMSKEKEALAEKAVSDEQSHDAPVLDAAFLESLIADGEELEPEESASEEQIEASEESASDGLEPEAVREPVIEEKEPVIEEVDLEEEPAVEDSVPQDSGAVSEDMGATRELPSLEEIFGERTEAPEEIAESLDKTKEFDISEIDNEAVKKILENEGVLPADEEISENDLFNDELVADVKAVKPSEKQEEFTEKALAEEMTEGIKNKSASMLVNALWGFLLTLISFYLSASCYDSFLPHPVFLQPGEYGIILLLVDIQILVVSCALVWGNIVSGLKKLFKGKADPDSVTAVAMFSVLIYQISLFFTDVNSENIMLFSAVGCLWGFLNSVYHFMDERRSYRCFKVVSSNKEKFIVRKLGTDSSEYELLKEHIPENPDIFTVEKTKFVNNYFSRTKAPAKLCGAYNAAVWLVLAAALIFAFYSFSGGFSQAARSFVTVMIFGLPACGLFAVAMPLGKFTKKCAKRDSAIIGATAVEDYSAASVISFNDTELFPAEKVRVTSIRTYSDFRLDKVIFYCAKIFGKVGGPLCRVFSDSLSGMFDLSDNFDILENTGDGICAKLEGKEVFVGNKDYMLSYDFGYVNDDIDEPFENSVGRIMYMAIGDRIAAKIYIRYAVNGKFERVMRGLYKTGTCVCIKTCDPNLDNDLIKCILRNKNYPVGVMKTAGASKEVAASENGDSGLVCTTGILNMLMTFIYCDKAKRLISINLLVKFLSVLVGVFVSIFLGFMGRMTSITTVFALVYQILWVIAVTVPGMSE